MSGPNTERAANVVQVVHKVEADFRKLAAVHNAVNWERECSFALEILNNNSYLMGIAMGDQDSLKRAVLNVAAIGLSLSPVSKLAYLVPRGKKVCLDISYRGYVQLAVDVGAIKWAKAEVVFAKDKFKVTGTNKEPVHEYEPFGDRGEIVGAYCIAKTHDGEFLVDMMTNDEIFSIRDRSESYKGWMKDNTKSTPWKTDTLEMIKKTMLKRASKSWPMTDTRQAARFAEAIDVTNDIDFSSPPQLASPKGNAENKTEVVRSLLNELQRDEVKFIGHLQRVYSREIKSLDDLTANETDQAIVMLNQFLDIAKAKAEAAKGETA